MNSSFSSYHQKIILACPSWKIYNLNDNNMYQPSILFSWIPMHFRREFPTSTAPHKDTDFFLCDKIWLLFEHIASDNITWCIWFISKPKQTFSDFHMNLFDCTILVTQITVWFCKETLKLFMREKNYRNAQNMITILLLRVTKKHIKAVHDGNKQHKCSKYDYNTSINSN